MKLVLILFTGLVIAEPIIYVSDLMGHVHRLPDIDSESLTSVQCGQKLRKLGSEGEFTKVRIAQEVGFVLKSAVAEQLPRCFQREFNAFYLGLDLDVTDFYYLGKLQEKLEVIEIGVPK